MNKLFIFISWLSVHLLIFIAHLKFILIHPPSIMFWLAFTMAIITHYGIAGYFKGKVVYTD